MFMYWIHVDGESQQNRQQSFVVNLILAIHIYIFVVTWVQELCVLWDVLNAVYILIRKHIDMNLFDILCLCVEFMCMTKVNKIGYKLVNLILAMYIDICVVMCKNLAYYE